MDNWFILSYKFGDKWTKVTFNMTSVMLGTCIHIVVKLSSEGDFFIRDTLRMGKRGTIRWTIRWTIIFDKDFTVIPKTHSVIQSMTP
jgi:hypothetical protein